MTDPRAVEFAKGLAPVLYSDIKACFVGIGRRVSKLARRSSLSEFGSPTELISTLLAGHINEGDWVRLKCKPSPFGPFLRTHFLTPLVGFNTELRLGPPLVGNNPVMGMLAQATSHLTPVGLYPPIEAGIVQACLYPPHAEACGMVGLIPDVSKLIVYLPAVLSERHTKQYGVDSWIVGTVQRIDFTALGDAGYSAEDQEVIRQSGPVWFLDATHDESNAYSIDAESSTALWGGLYASGHLEIRSGELLVSKYVEAFAAAMRSEGFTPHVSQNAVGAQEIALYAKGLRLTLGSSAPMFSFHMDAELSREFGTYRARFDRVVAASLGNLAHACAGSSVELMNSLDLDFTYTDSSSAYTVLRSAGASAIADPVAVSIRDWHRRRSIR